jgi:hypothetical protein
MFATHRSLLTERYIIEPAKYHLSVAILSLHSAELIATTLSLMETEIRAVIDAHFSNLPPSVTFKGMLDFRVCGVLGS